MHCCLHSAELEQLKAECLNYQRRAVAACGQPLDISNFFQRVKEEEQQALLEAVQVAHRASLQRLKCEYLIHVKTYKHGTKPSFFVSSWNIQHH